MTYQPRVKGARNLSGLLAEESRLPANCHSLNSTGGLGEGFILALAKPKLYEVGFHPPHLEIGHAFIARNRVGDKGCLYKVTPAGGVVRRATLWEVSPLNGNPFQVLNRPEGRMVDYQLLHVHHGLAQQVGVKVKDTVHDLNIWHGLCGSAERVLSNADQALVRFDADGQYLYVMYPNGLVRSVIRTEGRLVLRTLTAVEMAEVRVMEAQDQLAQCSGDADGIKRRNGIIFGMIRLLTVTRQQPAARRVILDFLHDQELSTKARQDVYAVLVDLDDMARHEFSDHATGMHFGDTNERKGPPPAAKAAKALKAAKDRQQREKMRGKSGGGDQSKGKRKKR